MGHNRAFSSLKIWAYRQGIFLPDEAWHRIEEYHRVLALFAHTTNLVGSASAEAFFLGHVSDSLFLLRAIPEGHSLLDVGSGAGFPGLVLACARPDLRVGLVEPRVRRAAFLFEAIRRLDLGNVSVVMERFPEGTVDLPGPRVLVSRATFPPKEWLKIGLAHTRHGEVLLALLSPGQAEEMKKRTKVLVCPDCLTDWWDYEIADGRRRALLSIRAACSGTQGIKR